MRTTILVILLFTLASVGLWQYRSQQEEITRARDKTLISNSSSASATANIQHEDSLIQQAIDQVMPLFEDSDQQPATSKPEPAISIDDLNLSLPVTVHPTTPALNLPDNKTLVLPPKKDQPASVSVGAGIEWDEKNQKAKGAKITITVPTG
jgi:hypothetical protein